jgi:glycosyltransferase involved in cell wall biosynthesis
MVTNAYPPLGGGVARSVERFATTFRRLGHRVLVVAPEVDGRPPDEEGVLRMPAVSEPFEHPFAVSLPVPGRLRDAVEAFGPDVVHAHHPFLLGDTALRVAASAGRPLVFTCHTRYGQYVEHITGRAGRLKRFVERLVLEYANRCRRVFAPSESMRRLLQERGVTTPVAVVPTGVDTARFARGDGRATRQRLGLEAGAFVVGHVGRLAAEKNIGFLARACARAVADRPEARCLIVGDGDEADAVRAAFRRAAAEDRLRLPGTLDGTDLVDAYHAMDVFAFASLTETQGMVLAEAMAAGVPLVALEAPGAREIVRDGANGFLLPEADEAAFARAIGRVGEMSDDARADLAREARRTAEAYGLEPCARRALEAYEAAVADAGDDTDDRVGAWARLARRLAAEYDLWSAGAAALGEALRDFS